MLSEKSAVMAVGLSTDRPDAILVSIDLFLNSRRVQLVNFASRHALPTIFGFRDCVEAGGLMS